MLNVVQLNWKCNHKSFTIFTLYCEIFDSLVICHCLHIHIWSVCFRRCAHFWVYTFWLDLYKSSFIIHLCILWWNFQWYLLTHFLTILSLTDVMDMNNVWLVFSSVRLKVCTLFASIWTNAILSELLLKYKKSVTDCVNKAECLQIHCRM